MEKSLVKKYISVLRLIAQRETLYPGDRTSADDFSEMGWEIDNLRFNLTIPEFTDLLSGLEKKGALTSLSGIVVPAYVGILSKIAHDENGTTIDSDQIIITYDKADTEKIKGYESELKEMLTETEISEIREASSISTEPILEQAGALNLRSSGLICYNENIIDMRTGLKTLTEIFIKRPNELVNRDDIMDELGTRSQRTKDTIAKYISELNTILESHFGRRPITNHKKEGWIFRP